MRRLFLLVCLIYFSLNVSANQNEYPPISPENVMNLQEVETIGQGALYPSLAWSPDGSRIVTGGAQGIFVFDSNYQNIDFIDMGKPVSISQFSPDGSFVYAYFDGKINAFDLVTRTVRYQLDGSILAMSQNGQMLAYSGYRSVIVADIATGETRYVLDYDGIWQGDYSDEYGYVRSSFVFAQFINEDEQVLLRWYHEEIVYESYGSHYSGSDVWTLADESFDTVMDDANAQRSEDELVAYDNNGDISLLNESYWHRNELRLDLFPPDTALRLKTDADKYWLGGNLFVAPVGTGSDSEDYDGIDASQTGIWNIQTGELIAIIPALGRVVFSPDRTKIAVGNEIFDLSSGERIAILQNDTYGVLSGVDDRILQYGADDSLRLLDARSMEEIAILPMKRSELAEIREIFSDGSFLLVDKTGLNYIRVSGISGEEVARFVVERSFGCLNLSQNERYFFCAYSSANYVLDGVWDSNTGEKIKFPENFVTLLMKFEVNQVIGWTGDSIGFFDLIQRDYVEEISLPENSFEGQPSALLMSKDGQYIAVFFNAEGLVIRRSTGEVITTFQGGANFNPSSSLLAFTDEERNLFVMNLADGQIIQSSYLSGDTPFPASLYFETDSIVSANLGGWDGANEIIYYNVLTGTQSSSAVPQTQPRPAIQAPFAEANGLRFYQDNGIRIEWNEQPISLRLNPANFSAASLSSDASRLYITYTDGRVGIWAVAE